MYTRSAMGAVDTEGIMRRAFEQGIDTPLLFGKRCARYGITKAKYGSSWDDKCIAHEYKNTIGPVFSGLRIPGAPAAAKAAAGMSQTTMLALGAAALLAIVLIIK